MANVSCDILYVHSEGQAGRNQYHIRVVRWNGGAPTLESREVYYVGDEERYAKARGLTLEQLQSIAKDELLMRAMQGEVIPQEQWGI